MKTKRNFSYNLLRKEGWGQGVKTCPLIALKKTAVFSILLAFTTIPPQTGNQSEVVLKGKIKGADKPAIVYIDKMLGAKPEVKQEQYEVRIENGKMNPATLVCVIGGSIKIISNDSDNHIVDVWFDGKYIIDTLDDAGEKFIFNQLGGHIFKCRTHKGESSNVLVVKYPLYAITDKSGNFEIKGLNPGKGELKIYSDDLQWSQCEKKYDFELRNSGENTIELEVSEPQNSGSIKGTVHYNLLKKYPTLVYIEDVNKKRFSSRSKVTMDQKNKVFIPHVLPVLKGTTVIWYNSDPFAHNVFTVDGEKYQSPATSPGQSFRFRFKKEGVYTQLCNLHPEMLAYVIVLNNPYYTMADMEGNFTIKNVPEGRYKLKVWNEKLKEKRLNKTFEITVERDKESTIEIKP